MDTKNRIHELDLKGETSGLSSDEASRRVNLWADLWQARSMQHSLLFQKSRYFWLKECDTNSENFHKLVSTRRWSNTLSGLRVNGKWIDDYVKESSITSQPYSLNRTLLALLFMGSSVSTHSPWVRDLDLYCSQESLRVHWFWGGMVCIVGDGSNTSFWHDN
ncbi:hypothetical protein Lal_00030263 [Lupinus albus]|nr:hypothetical protein Lal_00030263 [Lupinus albus]